MIALKNENRDPTYSFIPAECSLEVYTCNELPIFEPHFKNHKKPLPFEQIKMEKIRKEIHLPSEMVLELKIVAVNIDKSVKRFMEDLIVYEVKMQIAKIKGKLS